MDRTLIKYIIQVTIYLIAFIFSAFAVKAIPFHRFLDHSKVREAFTLYILTVLALTFCIGGLVIKFLGLEIWLA